MISLKHPLVFSGISVSLVLLYVLLSKQTKTINLDVSVQKSIYIAQIPLKRPSKDPMLLYTQLVCGLSHLSAVLKMTTPNKIQRETGVDVKQLKNNLFQQLRSVNQSLKIPEHFLKTIIL